MRLSANQVDVIKQEIARYFGPDSEVWLFGSRVDDHRRGGDIDLYVTPGIADPDRLAAARFAFLAHLKRRIGDLRIDLVLHRANAENLPIYSLARQEGIHL